MADINDGGVERPETPQEEALRIARGQADDAVQAANTAKTDDEVADEWAQPLLDADLIWQAVAELIDELATEVRGPPAQTSVLLDKLREIMGRPGPNPAKDRANERAGKQ